MKKLFLFSIVLHISLLSVSAQKNDRPFRAYLYNNEYEVFMRLDLYGESITVPGQELYGELPGYISKKRNSFCWLITSSKIDGDKAELQMINDYGSEDLTATLTVENDSPLRVETGRGKYAKSSQGWEMAEAAIQIGIQVPSLMGNHHLAALMDKDSFIGRFAIHAGTRK